MIALRKNLSVVSAPVIYSKKKKGKGKNRLTGGVFSHPVLPMETIFYSGH